MIRLSFIIFGLLLLSACAKFDDHNLLATPEGQGLGWEMVSLKGLDEALLATDQADIVEQIDFKYTDLDDIKVRAGITKNPVKKRSLLINFMSCNSGAATYSIRGGKLRYKIHVGTLILCGRIIDGETGRRVILGTAAIVDELFQSLAPQVTNYDVSPDGQILTLVDKEGLPLGVFKRLAKS